MKTLSQTAAPGDCTYRLENMTEGPLQLVDWHPHPPALWCTTASQLIYGQHQSALHLASSTVHAYNTWHTAQYMLTTHSIQHSTCLQHTVYTIVRAYNTRHAAQYMFTTHGTQHTTWLQHTAYSTVCAYNTRHTAQYVLTIHGIHFMTNKTTCIHLPHPTFKSSQKNSVALFLIMLKLVMYLYDTFQHSLLRDFVPWLMLPFVITDFKIPQNQNKSK